jgi:hypothetical protein
MKALRELTHVLLVRVFVFVLGTVTSPRVSAAMEIQMFDDMAVQDQKEYIKFLVKDAERVLIEQDQRDQAAKLHELFQKIPSGEHRSLGDAQFETNLARLRSYAAESAVDPHGFRFRVTVENALIVTMNENGVTTTGRFENTLAQIVREKPFWPKFALRTK